MALKLDILANTRQFVSEMKKGGASVEDISDALDVMARDGEEAGESLERSFREVVRASETTGRSVGRNMDEGFDRAKKGADDFKDEARSTAKEAAASFDGSADSIADAFQEIAANSFAGFGPAGAIAGLAAATGIGLAAAGFTAADEARRQSEENIAGWAQSFIDAGGKFLTAGVMAARAEAILTDSEKFKQAETNAKNWGVSIETAISAMTGNESSIREVKAAVDELADAYEEARKKTPIDEFGQVNATLIEQEQAYRAAADSLAILTGEISTGQKRARILNDYYSNLINSTAGVTEEVDKLGNSLYSLPDGTQVYVDAETGQASQNVQDFKGDLDGIPRVVKSRVDFTANTTVFDRAWNEIQRKARSGITVNTAWGGVRPWV